jgi:hypothetical protein
MKTGIFIALVLIIFISFFFVNTLVNKTIETSDGEQKETVKVGSIFGCLTLRDKYTEAEWTAAQNLNEKVWGYRLIRCE